MNRIEIQEDGGKRLAGRLTDDELAALRTAVDIFDSLLTPAAPLAPEASAPVPVPSVQPISPALDAEPNNTTRIDESFSLTPTDQVRLDVSALSAEEAPKNARFCLDFGTAMSKATLVVDDDDTEAEEIRVLPLGRPGDQEEISETMLISSVYIDNEGKLWFGKAAVDRSMHEGKDGTRGRLDNIKRRLSEEGWDEQVDERFNPTGVPVSHAVMVLAYLTFLTWTANSCLGEMGYPRNLGRRFAMPCFAGEKRREIFHRLKKLVGEAQVLSDTFDSALQDGVPIRDFVCAVKLLRGESREYSYVLDDITEPLGIANSIVSWTRPVDSLVLVIDIGAGTSDLSLYRLNIDPDKNQSMGIEIEGSSRVLTEAGNYLDRLLIELIIKKSGITSDDKRWVNVRSALELQIRDFKESLFQGGSVFVPLMNGIDVDIELQDFLALEAVRQFGENLRMKMVGILEAVDKSWVTWIKVDPRRCLTVALTGGGADLPMVKTLADGSIPINGVNILLRRALPFPGWLRDTNENIESDYPRVAVSLGGARRRLTRISHQRQGGR